MGHADRGKGVLIMTTDYLLILIPLLPLILALSMPLLRTGHIMILAPVTALLAALLIPVNSSVHLPWVLTGVHWQLDSISQLFLLFSAVIWLVTSLYVVFARDAQTNRAIYRCLFMLAMSGNMLLIVAADMTSFYLGFAMMGLSTYGLILRPSQRARRAARVYLGFTLVGELALFIAMLILFQSTGSMLFIDIHHQPIPDLAVAFLLLGFGIKLALPGLHPWLPLTYTAAPLISVAVLSGPMMKAGLLGWIRFLPPGDANLQTWGGVLIWLGVAGLVLGSILALMQHRASAILAYSSIAKMGLLSSFFGYAMAHPEQSDIVIGALVLFAMHHLLVKSALFIGLNEYQQRQGSSWVYYGLVLLSLSLIGLPFSGGSGAKSALDLATEGDLVLLLMLSGFASALMMMHFLWTVKEQAVTNGRMPGLPATRSGPNLAWWLLLPLAWFGPFMPGAIQFDSKSLLVTASAIALFFYIRQTWSRPSTQALIIQPGDIYHLFKGVRLISPVLIKREHRLIALFTWPQPGSGKLSGSLSLTVPGLLWFAVLTLLIISLLIPS
jgi:formate hydrogenlyase subunit 3/multisubunit Na+/H+ antiporter MnhD subunit